MFGRGGVGRQVAGEHRDSGKRCGTITDFPLCLKVASDGIPQQGPGRGLVAEASSALNVALTFIYWSSQLSFVALRTVVK